jgi:DNA replicative helicase MCM subunit Mcm2 (Cdc46/Mcm family)
MLFGRFDKYESLTKQVNLAPALLSRFDLIFLLLDQPNPKRDEEIARHILVDAQKTELVLDQEFLRKYLACACRLNPALRQETSKRLSDHYTTIRRNTSEGLTHELELAIWSTSIRCGRKCSRSWPGRGACMCLKRIEPKAREVRRRCVPASRRDS